jgi:dTDP-4-dehydrorhamnose 3,5-epimerase
VSLTINEIFFKNVCVFSPKTYSDNRGYFFESWNKKSFNKLLDVNYDFVQDNHSISVEGTLRGLHYQFPNPQGKLVRVTSGEIFDVIVDIRESSSTFGQWRGVNLSSDNMKQIWIPPGFAHGFLTLSSKAEVLYKTTDYWHKENEKTIIWNDKDISIDWPATKKVIISEKDQNGIIFKKAQYFK